LDVNGIKPEGIFIYDAIDAPVACGLGEVAVVKITVAEAHCG
jgi:hypothetical protein